jgi:hypothetical protein
MTAMILFHLYRWTHWRWLLELDTWRVRRKLHNSAVRLRPLWGSPDWRIPVGKKES